MRFRTQSYTPNDPEQSVKNENLSYTYSPVTIVTLNKFQSMENQNNSHPTELILTGNEWIQLSKANFSVDGYIAPVAESGLRSQLTKMAETTNTEPLSPEQIQIVVKSVNNNGGNEFEVVKLISSLDNTEHELSKRMSINKNDFYRALEKVAKQGEENALPKIV